MRRAGRQPSGEVAGAPTPVSAAADASRPPPTRDWCVAVFIADRGRVLLHYHRKLGRWLPPGGHVEPNELPDDAARREVREETGVEVRLLGGPGIPVAGAGHPRQLCRPAGLQLVEIAPGHEHIDLVYLATPASVPDPPPDCVGWYAPEDLAALHLSDEVATWCARATSAAAAAGRSAAGDPDPYPTNGALPSPVAPPR